MKYLILVAKNCILHNFIANTEKQEIKVFFQLFIILNSIFNSYHVKYSAYFL